MEVVVDGIIYQLQSKGGISRLYTEILPRMCDMDESIKITLLTKGLLKQAIPKHPHIVHRSLRQMDHRMPPVNVLKPIMPKVRRFARRLWIGRGKNKIWHSTYYTLPEKWEGRQVVTVVDMIHERYADYFTGPGDERLREQKRNCVLAADTVICISETTGQEVQRFYGVDGAKIKVIPLAHSDLFKPLAISDCFSKMPSIKPFFLYVGTRVHYKNFEGLLSAYRDWPGRRHVDLVVVGRSWLPDEEKSLMKRGIQNQVHLLVDVDDKSLCHLYNRATALIYPSFYEGFGIPLLEAMACGCPIVASRIPSTIEVAGECPIYFEPNDVESLLAALYTVLSEGRDSERVEAGFEQIKRYSWNKTALQTLNVYHSL